MDNQPSANGFGKQASDLTRSVELRARRAREQIRNNRTDLAVAILTTVHEDVGEFLREIGTLPF